MAGRRWKIPHDAEFSTSPEQCFADLTRPLPEHGSRAGWRSTRHACMEGGMNCGDCAMTGIGFFKRLLGHPAANDQPEETRCLAATGTRMLVVDDSPTICAVLGRMLEKDGYAVQKAADGESALERAREAQPELIFLDIVLPGINGFAVLRALRHDPLTAHIPIVMISGNQQATEQFYVQRFGADDFIRKPFGRAEVSACIHQLVKAGRLAGRTTVPAAPVAVPADATVAKHIPSLLA
jgi:twitching motility two-component system response regulator PilH